MAMYRNTNNASAYKSISWISNCEYDFHYKLVSAIECLISEILCQPIKSIGLPPLLLALNCDATKISTINIPVVDNYITDHGQVIFYLRGTVYSIQLCNYTWSLNEFVIFIAGMVGRAFPCPDFTSLEKNYFKKLPQRQCKTNMPTALCLTY